MSRLPELSRRDELLPNAQQVYDDIIQARGKLAKSYAVMLHAPTLVDRILKLATNIRFESSLSRMTLELIALTVCAELDNQYEIDVHTPTALNAGVDAVTLEAIKAKVGLSITNEDVRLPVECARELVSTHRLSDASFERAHRLFGSQGVVEFVGAVGFYSMMSLMQNALQVRAQD